MFLKHTAEDFPLDFYHFEVLTRAHAVDEELVDDIFWFSSVPELLEHVVHL